MQMQPGREQAPLSSTVEQHRTGCFKQLHVRFPHNHPPTHSKFILMSCDHTYSQTRTPHVAHPHKSKPYLTSPSHTIASSPPPQDADEEVALEAADTNHRHRPYLTKTHSTPPLHPPTPHLVTPPPTHPQDADEEVALEAAEFWLAFCESELGMELLQPVMSRLIPVLMHNMVRGSGNMGVMGKGGRGSIQRCCGGLVEDDALHPCRPAAGCETQRLLTPAKLGPRQPDHKKVHTCSPRCTAVLPVSVALYTRKINNKINDRYLMSMMTRLQRLRRQRSRGRNLTRQR